MVTHATIRYLFRLYFVNHGSHCTLQVTSDTEDLVRYLCGQVEEDLQRLRVIFRWVTENIRSVMLYTVLKGKKGKTVNSTRTLEDFDWLSGLRKMKLSGVKRGECSVWFFKVNICKYKYCFSRLEDIMETWRLGVLPEFCVCIHAYMCIHIYIHAWIHVHTQISIKTYIHAIHPYMYVHIHVYMCIYTHM